ncbi:MAG TPA: zinc metalloprotease HtpX [Vicinamibacterales bacterium]
MWNQLKTVTFLGVLSALAVGAASYFAPQWGLAMAAVAVVMNLGAYFYSDRIVLRMHGAREIAPHEYPALHEMNHELSQRSGIPAPRLFVIEADYANAFATGRGPGHSAVAFTTGLLSRLTPREVRGVLAHELAHVQNRDVLIATVAAMLAAVVSGIANVLQFSAIFGGSQSDDEEGGSPIGTLAFALVAPIAASLVQLAISRSREYVADETAARLTREPGALASALERLHRSAATEPQAVPAPATASLFIVSPFAGASTMLALFSTHPPVERRIARLRRLSGRPVAA